jgi:E1A-binding protein p400
MINKAVSSSSSSVVLVSTDTIINQESTILSSNDSLNNQKRKINLISTSDPPTQAHQSIEKSTTTSSELFEESESALIAITTEQLKKKICLTQFRLLNNIRNDCIAELAEKFYLENDYNYLHLDKWKPGKETLDYIDTQFPTKDNLIIIDKKLNQRFQLENKNLFRECSLKQNADTSAATADQNKVSSSSAQKENRLTIAERAKHDASILNRIMQLRRDGLWSIKRLPKLVEPQRPKSHWDFLLDEMMWMSTDFIQERKWKKNVSRKLASAVQKYFKEKEASAEMAEREEAKRLRKLATTIGRDIMTFWRNVESVVAYKQKTRIEEKRKQAMDTHLNFIVDQTEKYSSWLMQSLNSAPLSVTGSVSKPDSSQTESADVSITTKDADSDMEYEGNISEMSEEDDEETIEKEEKMMITNAEMTAKTAEEEIALLQKESERSIDDLLKEYNIDESYFARKVPTNSELADKRAARLLERNARLQSQAKEDSDDDEEEETEDDDDEDESTIQSENDKSDSFNSNETKTITDDENDDNDDDDDNLTESDNNKKEYSLEHLLKIDTESEPQTDKTTSTTTSPRTAEEQEVLNSISATAQSFQPTGYTLETSNVKVKLPFLLTTKLKLREYQHVGLDWLVTMYENKLNGILADEMGLGKTIQTIALLAHLACDKGIWGPHLIVVPTSVMLNWELEFKKWCPGFKILTYYGSQKERKMKRQVRFLLI